MDFISSVFAIKEELTEENRNSSQECSSVEAEYAVDLPTTPWPRFNKFLLYRTTNGNNHIFLCKLCLPKKHEVKAHKSSYSNIRSHFRKKHPIRFGEIDRVCKTSSVRGKKGFKSTNGAATNSEQFFVKSTLQLIPQQAVTESHGVIPEQIVTESHERIPESHFRDAVDKDARCFSCLSESNANAVTHDADNNQPLLDLIICGMHPLSIVDCPWFRKYSESLNPSITIPSGQTLGRKILNMYDERKQQLIRYDLA